MKKNFSPKDILKDLKTKEGRQFGTAYLVHSAQIDNNSDLHKCLNFYQSISCNYLCSSLYASKSSIYETEKNQLIQQLDHSSDKTKNEIESLKSKIRQNQSQEMLYFQNAFESAMKNSLFSYGAQLAKKKALNYFSKATHHLDQVEIIQIKKNTSLESRSKAGMKMLGNDEARHRQEGQQAYQSAFSLLKNILSCLEKAEDWSQYYQSIQLEKEKILEHLEKTKGTKQAHMHSIRKRWFDHTARLSIKLGQSPDKWKHLHQEDYDKTLHKGEIFERKALEYDYSFQSYKQQAQEKSTQNPRPSFITNFIVKLWQYKAKKYKKKSIPYFQKAIKEYAKVGKFGKVPELELKRGHHKSKVEDLIIAADRSIFNGDIVARKTSEQELKANIEEMENDYTPNKIIQLLKKKYRILVKFNQYQREAESLEIKYEDSPNPQDKWLKKALEYCELAGLFQYAFELASKSESLNNSVYQFFINEMNKQEI